MPLDIAMKARHVLVLAVSIASFLSGCTPSDEARVERLTRHRSWPRIQQVAETEVKKREKLFGWPDSAGYFPMEHKDGVWVVGAMAETPVHRVVTLMIGDDGTVLTYKRHWEGE
jgi:hypothetical protein